MIDQSVTIILPVYGRPKLLEQALNSVYALNNSSWRLHIADDGSDQATRDLIQSHLNDPRITYSRRKSNLGLFKNLTIAVSEIKTEWLLILCSDDLLEQDALDTLNNIQQDYPTSHLILSAYSNIDKDGKCLPNTYDYYTNKFAPHTQLFYKTDLIPHLLHYGSINGNITGMLIKKTLFRDAGYWIQSWSQAADWEWLIRASSVTDVVINRRVVSKVRIHTGQLSSANRTNYREISESLATLSLLLKSPKLSAEPRRHLWAAHHSQFLLWNLLKTNKLSNIPHLIHNLNLFSAETSLFLATVMLIVNIPRRLICKISRKPLLPLV